MLVTYAESSWVSNVLLCYAMDNTEKLTVN